MAWLKRERDMAHDWLIREIEGLRDYAALNGLRALAAHLEQARLLAQTEIASRGDGGAGQSAGPGMAG